MFLGLSNIKYETIDLVNDDFLDDQVTLNSSEECKGSTSADFQAIDAEIIDYGVSEDELEDTLFSLETSSNPRSKSSSPVLKPSELKNCNLKCLCVKVVDCDKYPWYYRKYKKQILHKKYFDKIKNTRTIWNGLKNYVNESNNNGERNVASESISKNYSRKDDGNFKTDMNLTTSSAKKALHDEKHLANKITEKTANQKLQLSIETAKRNVNSKDIDIKKNKGLIGMKVQRMVANANTNKKCVVKKKKEKSEKSVEKQLNQDSGKLTGKTMEYKALEKLHHYALTVPVIHEIKPKTLETERLQNKQNDEFTSLSSNKSIEKNIESNCDLKMANKNVFNISTKNKLTNNEECVQKENKCKEGEVLQLNSFTKKVLQMIKRNANISSRQDVTSMKTALNPTSKQELKKQIQTKPDKLNSTEKYLMPIQEIKSTDWNISNKKVRPADILMGNKNQNKTHDFKQKKISKVMSNSKITDYPKANQAIIYSTMLTKSNSDETKTNASDVQPNIVVNKKSLLKLSTDIPLPQNLADFKDDNISNRRKQVVKQFEIDAGEYDSLISKMNKTGPESLPTQKNPNLQENPPLTQNTARNNISNSNNVEIISTQSAVKATNHAPIKTQISAILIRPTQSSNTSTAKINVIPVVSSAQPRNPPTNYQTAPNFEANTPRPLMSIPIPQLFSNPPPPIRHRLPFRQVSPWNRNMYQQPNNYVRPMVQGCSQMPPFNTNVCQEPRHYMHNYMQNNNNLQHNYGPNNYVQRPVAPGQGYPGTSASSNAPPGICNVLPNNVRWQYDYVYPNSAPHFFRTPPPPPVSPFQNQPWPQNQSPQVNQPQPQEQLAPENQLPPQQQRLQEKQIPLPEQLPLLKPPLSQQQLPPQKQQLPSQQQRLCQQQLPPQKQQLPPQQQPLCQQQLPPQKQQLPPQQQPLYQQQLPAQKQQLLPHQQQLSQQQLPSQEQQLPLQQLPLSQQQLLPQKQQLPLQQQPLCRQQLPPQKQQLPPQQQPLYQQQLPPQKQQLSPQQQPLSQQQLPPQKQQLPPQQQPLYQQQLPSQKQQLPPQQQPLSQQQLPPQKQKLPPQQQQLSKQQLPPQKQQLSPQKLQKRPSPKKRSLPEKQLPVQNTSNYSVLNNSSIIGKNSSGLVKKINITAPLTNESQNNNYSDKNVEKNNKNVLTRTADSTSPVITKLESMKQVENQIPVKKTVNNELKRPLPFEQSLDRAPNVKYKPGPLSKKFKTNNGLKIGYSLPILPIPTYQTILSEVQATMLENLSAPGKKINKKHDPCKKISKTEGFEKEHNLKKISLKEYKKRSMNNKKE